MSGNNKSGSNLNFGLFSTEADLLGGWNCTEAIVFDGRTQVFPISDRITPIHSFTPSVLISIPRNEMKLMKLCMQYFVTHS
jgi:hypothetical protein